MQFDSRPGLKFLVQKVSRFDVAANLYRQAGIARTVYTHVLLELCVRLEDLGVHKIKQLLGDGDGSEAVGIEDQVTSASATVNIVS